MPKIIFIEPNGEEKEIDAQNGISILEVAHKNGIDLLRMTYKAYGESKLLNRCEDDQECEDAMHQVNRRTELRIIQENKD